MGDIHEFYLWTIINPCFAKNPQERTRFGVVAFGAGVARCPSPGVWKLGDKPSVIL